MTPLILQRTTSAIPTAFEAYPDPYLGFPRASLLLPAIPGDSRGLKTGHSISTINISVVTGVAIAILCLAQGALRGELLVSPWEVDCVVSDSNSQSSVTFIRDENPFHNSHTAFHGSSYASASYDFAWTGDSAHFDVYPSHYLQQLEGRTSSDGRIIVSPAVDSIISLTGTWQFAWPNTVIGATDIGFAVGDTQTKEIIVNDGAHGGNFDLGPPHGTLNIQGSGLLLAGVEYLIYYTALVDHYDPTPPGTHGEASGAIHFEIMPVPEPAALALLASALLLAPRRRRHSLLVLGVLAFRRFGVSVPPPATIH